MKHVLITLIFLGFISTIIAQNKKLSKDDLKTTKQKVSYAIGHDVGKNTKLQGIEISVDEFMQGFKDALSDNPVLTEQEITQIIISFQQEMMAEREAKNKVAAQKNKKDGKAFLEANAQKEGVVTLSSGLQYKVIKRGNGPQPTKSDKVKVHYRGTSISGEEFDSSYKRGEPTEFPVTGVIKGWTEALLLMHVGDKWELYIPYDLAYGESGNPPVIQPAQTLLFEVELLEIVK
ncbi:MAG: FKBP-type peptidyl-prolyl cis-trans isomerase [Melioribacteraceae bacterium]|nr:FKBP-type peptidyl-prolyl cis-trans isomerase [Melioribacteraceae bacterium]